MNLEHLKTLIGLVFKKGKADFPETTNKTQLAEKIVKSSLFYDTIKSKSLLSSKSLLNYFNYFFDESLDEKEPKPHNDTIDLLMKYINFQSQKQFINNAPKIIFLTDVPFIKNKKKEEDSNDKGANMVSAFTEPSDSIFEGSYFPKRQFMFLFASLCLVAFVVIFALSKNSHNTEKENETPQITINTEHFVVSDLNKIIPNQETHFFDQNNLPQVWYASNNNQLDFYNTKGIHPITKEPLKPVTKEIVKTIFVEKTELYENKDNEPESSFISTPYVLNTTLKNNPNKEQLSLFITDSNDKLDIDVTNTIKRRLKEKGYSITAPLVASSKLNQEVISNLQILNKDYFKAELSRFTDYLCIGAVTYNYSQSTISENLKTCKLSLDYSIISTNNGEEIDTFSKTISGTGSNEQSAKQNALYKLSL